MKLSAKELAAKAYLNGIHNRIRHLVKNNDPVTLDLIYQAFGKHSDQGKAAFLKEMRNNLEPLLSLDDIDLTSVIDNKNTAQLNIAIIDSLRRSQVESIMEAVADLAHIANASASKLKSLFGMASGLFNSIISTVTFTPPNIDLSNMTIHEQTTPSRAVTRPTQSKNAAASVEVPNSLFLTPNQLRQLSGVIPHSITSLSDREVRARLQLMRDVAFVLAHSVSIATSQHPRHATGGTLAIRDKQELANLSTDIITTANEFQIKLPKGLFNKRSGEINFNEVMKFLSQLLSTSIKAIQENALPQRSTRGRVEVLEDTDVTTPSTTSKNVAPEVTSEQSNLTKKQLKRKEHAKNATRVDQSQLGMFDDGTWMPGKQAMPDEGRPVGSTHPDLPKAQIEAPEIASTQSNLTKKQLKRREHAKNATRVDPSQLGLFDDGTWMPGKQAIPDEGRPVGSTHPDLLKAQIEAPEIASTQSNLTKKQLKRREHAKNASRVDPRQLGLLNDDTRIPGKQPTPPSSPTSHSGEAFPGGITHTPSHGIQPTPPDSPTSHSIGTLPGSMTDIPPPGKKTTPPVLPAGHGGRVHGKAATGGRPVTPPVQPVLTSVDLERLLLNGKTDEMKLGPNEEAIEKAMKEAIRSMRSNSFFGLGVKGFSEKEPALSGFLKTFMTSTNPADKLQALTSFICTSAEPRDTNVGTKADFGKTRSLSTLKRELGKHTEFVVLLKHIDTVVNDAKEAHNKQGPKGPGQE